MNKFWILYILFWTITTTAIAQDRDIPNFSFGEKTNATTPLTLKGTITESEDQLPIPGAIIQIIDQNINTVTNIDGVFSLELDPGVYIVEIKMLGYKDYKAQISLYIDAEWSVILEPGSIELTEVTVTERRENENVISVLTGAKHMNIEQIERQSKFLGELDVLRSIQSVTGVSSVGEGASGFNVRGGNTDENLILMDNNLIFNPVHALGFFSLFHPDMVEGVTLFKGGVPAKYGGRLSSVLDVQLREGNNDRFSVKGGLGLASSRLVLEGPIIKDKVSFMIGSRYSYFDWLLKRTGNVDLLKSKASFGDLTAKMDARLSPTTSIGFTAFTTTDLFQFAEEVKFDYQTTSGAAYLKQILGDNINITLRYNKGKYTSNLFDITGNDQSKFTNQIVYDRISLDAYYQPVESLNFQAGVELQDYQLYPGELQPIGESILAAQKQDRERGNERSFFGNFQFAPSEKFEILGGIRHTTFNNIGPDNLFIYQEGIPKTEETIIDTIAYGSDNSIVSYMGLEPRISMRYSLGESNSIKVGYNRSYQFISQVSNTASATPIDIWQLSNNYIQPQKADNISLGYYHNFRDNTIKTYGVLFYRKIHNLIDFKDFAQLLLNDHIETELLSGIGKAYGFELLLDKTYGQHKWEVNYTFSRTLRKVEATANQESVNNGAWYSSNYDKPHNININYLYKINEKNSFSVNFTYSTGRPTTAPISSYANSNILTIPVYSDRNQFRIPSYHRMDVAYTIGPWGKGRWKNSLTLSIYNLYFRKNAFSVFFRQRPFQSVTTYRVAVLGTMFPAITYNFTW